ncbi:MAG: bifunctional oligoribonuclease/PAP phosphatase NrnA [Nitrospirae bacterium]|nr:bifunctional oligoribonuclease/PAP phosphatase NrnA [Nitrospirota bacterium]
MKVPADLLSFFKREKKFFIATHINPDGDALGSSIALAITLESMGKKTIPYCNDPVPEFYKFLPGHERFTNSISDLQPSTFNLVLLDCNELSRAEVKNTGFVSSVVIDHHETETEFGDIKWVNPRSPATGIMVYYLIKELGMKITKEIATNLYSAIAIDTGTFRYTNTTPESLRIAAELIEFGADPSYIAENIYETWSERRFKLLLKVLSTLEISGEVATVLVTQDMLKETGASAEDTENFPGFPRMLKSIKISALFREIEKDYYKVSLRSKGEKLNVAGIAVTFGGGGHRNAAGYRIRADFKKAKEELLKAIYSNCR